VNFELSVSKLFTVPVLSRTVADVYVYGRDVNLSVIL